MTKKTYFTRETAEIVAESLKHDYPNIGVISVSDIYVNEKGIANAEDATIYSYSYIGLWNVAYTFMHNFGSHEEVAGFIAMCHYISECDTPPEDEGNEYSGEYQYRLGGSKGIEPIYPPENDHP